MKSIAAITALLAAAAVSAAPAADANPPVENVDIVDFVLRDTVDKDGLTKLDSVRFNLQLGNQIYACDVHGGVSFPMDTKFPVRCSAKPDYSWALIPYDGHDFKYALQIHHYRGKGVYFSGTGAMPTNCDKHYAPGAGHHECYETSVAVTFGLTPAKPHAE
ncbi:uncharacterized protein UV8b_00888 [Ustilaginoidea virens]|uniref:AA1-like domain-containing protein n=1 Tax=Ustilaginoidea virens TaxID=1159556 RepID=A0A063C3F1_USTVR|nr:uncharacterized protein UV8b_00888 [Ustilaginoidea virens]QUC16647.1 hypothetical protein UV8b_00888 [Ustilaginoidea virens]GAO18044.1 hypothetical protein UVI_02042910 [Ustilaginoidea virens]